MGGAVVDRRDRRGHHDLHGRCVRLDLVQAVADGRLEIREGGPLIAQRWAVRTTGDPEGLAAAVRAEVARMDPRLPVSQVEPMTEFLTRAAGATRFALVLIGVFGAVAAVLAAIGLYGVLSYTVTLRRW